jgi:hypothetical protein
MKGQQFILKNQTSQSTAIISQTQDFHASPAINSCGEQNINQYLYPYYKA